VRIRSIKPEFWSHPVTGRLPGDVQAIAIGLLSFADDEGYLVGDVEAIKSAIRPFDESSANVRRCVDDLSRRGWVEFRNHPTHGRIGYLPTFTKHQKVDKPKPSRLKEYWTLAVDDSSPTNPRRVGDASALDQGAGIRDQVVELAPKKPRRTPKQAELVKPPPDPRHAPLVKDLTEAFQQARGNTYPFDGGRDARVVSNLLARAEPGPLLEAWRRALRHQGFPTVSTLADFDRHLPRFLGESKPMDGRDPDFDHAASWGIP